MRCVTPFNFATRLVVVALLAISSRITSASNETFKSNTHINISPSVGRDVEENQLAKLPHAYRSPIHHEYELFENAKLRRHAISPMRTSSK